MFASSVKEPISRKERGVRNHLEEANRHAKEGEADLDSAVHAMGKDVRDVIENAIDSAGSGFSQAREKIYDTTETVAQKIRERPVASTAIAAAAALGVGIFLGALFRR
jgi:ElaB/YqjD/DUF883 family membrane-anchored ribosome-binding protein